jgi:hypothetical protein
MAVSRKDRPPRHGDVAGSRHADVVLEPDNRRLREARSLGVKDSARDGDNRGPLAQDEDERSPRGDDAKGLGGGV